MYRPAKIGNFYVVVGIQQQILWLDVAMDNFLKSTMWNVIIAYLRNCLMQKCIERTTYEFEHEHDPDSYYTIFNSESAINFKKSENIAN